MGATPDERAAGLVNWLLDDRLQGANNPPGLREAVADRFVERIQNLDERCGAQIDQLRSPSSTRIPDAYLADEEAIENDLQECAAGIRAALALEGLVSDDPIQFEFELAECLAPTARWSLRAEASRVPRPPTRPAALAWSLAPIPWIQTESDWPPPGALLVANRRQLHGPEAEPERVTEAPYIDWVQVGMLERQRTLATTYPKTPARHLLIALGLEVCDEPPPARSMPLAGGPPSAWAVTHDRPLPGLNPQQARARLAANFGPLSALVDYSGQRGEPSSDRGIGLHPFALAPRAEVIALLGLRPEIPSLRHVLIDDHGPGLVGRLWRGFLIHDGSYSPLEPAVHGADLLLRPDLYQALERAMGRERLTLGLTVSHSVVPAADGEPDSED